MVLRKSDISFASKCIEHKGRVADLVHLNIMTHKQK